MCALNACKAYAVFPQPGGPDTRVTFCIGGPFPNGVGIILFMDRDRDTAHLVVVGVGFSLRSVKGDYCSMQALQIVALILVNIALLVHLGEKAYRYWRDRRRMQRLVNRHPEMNGVHPDEDSLFVFESDASLKAFVLNNDEPGTSEPFDISEEDFN